MSSDEIPGTESAYETNAAPGTLAKHLLSNEHFQTLTVEIQPVVGFEPYQQSLNYLDLFLNKYLAKPGGIQIVTDPAIPAPAHAAGQTGYTVDDVKKIESAHRKRYSTKGNLAVFVLYADWDSNDDINSTKLLGEAYQNSSIVIFKNTMQTLWSAPTGTGISPYVFEATVLEHEFGHLMGLVNENGKGSTHEDPNSPRHCVNKSCLMAAQIETSGTNAAATAPPELDADCQADLKALAGE
jgi:hypothetical protein